jgi:hypothetical protein
MNAVFIRYFQPVYHFCLLYTAGLAVFIFSFDLVLIMTAAELKEDHLAMFESWKSMSGIDKDDAANM